MGIKRKTGLETLQERYGVDLQKERAVETQKVLKKEVPGTFNRKLYLKVLRDRGYHGEKEFLQELSKVLGFNWATMRNRFETRPETITLKTIIAVASILEMTPREFCDVFFNGLFEETPSGGFAAKPLLEEEQD